MIPGIKEKFIFSLLAMILAWNVVLSVKTNQGAPTINNNHELFDSLYQRHERRLLEIQREIILIDSAIVRDSVFVYTADRSTRDSLRALYNPN